MKHDVFTDTSKYAVLDGKLWVWKAGRCYGLVFNGTSTDPVGDWNLSDALAELPAGLKTGCFLNLGFFGDVYENYRTSWKISEHEVAGSVALDFCPADLFGPDISAFFSADTGVFIARNTCKQLLMTNSKGENGVFNFTKKGDFLHAEFQYKTKTCMLGQDYSFGDKDPTCPDLTDKFYTCVAGAGFSKLAGFPKTGAAAKASPPSTSRKYGEGVRSIPNRFGTAR